MGARDCFKPNSIQFGLDLISSAWDHLIFLDEVNRHSCLNDQHYIRKAIQRYEKFWLPLAADNPTIHLAAPLDIEWVWHCHMLAPDAYHKDCTDLVGKVVDHKLLDPKRRTKVLENSKYLWNQAYAAEYPEEVFELQLSHDAVQKDFSFESSLSYDLMAATARQKSFYYQVSLPHFRDVKFLENSLLRYKKYLYLKKMNPEAYLVPCYDIDLIWHTHQIHPLIYEADTTKLLGKLFNHDDTVNDRKPGSKLNKADAATRKYWRDEFHEAFSNFGAMFRGDPPYHKLHRIHQGDTYAFSTKTAFVDLEKISIEGLDNSIGKIKLQIHYASNLSKGPVLVNLKGTDREWSRKSLPKFEFDTKEFNILKIRLQENEGVFCFGSKRDVILDTSFDFLPVLEGAGEHGSKLNECFENTSGKYGKVRLRMNGFIESPNIGACLLFLQSGRYDLCKMPLQAEKLWGPIPLPQSDDPTNTRCSVASHSLFNHTGRLVFTCRVIHCAKILMSAVHVFYQDKMAAVAHLVGSDQLPLPTQVRSKESCITLNPRRGERGILIKNHSGDWGILIGRWEGYKKGVAGIKGTAHHPARPGRPGSPGYLTVTFTKLSTGKTTQLSLPYQQNIFSFSLYDVTANMRAGAIHVNAEKNEVAENLALTFSIALLHVLCLPRPKSWQPGMSTRPKNIKIGSKKINYIPSEDLALIMAAGHLEHTPSNFYIHSNLGVNACSGCAGGDPDVSGVAIEPEGIGDLEGLDLGVDAADTTVIDIGGDAGGCGG